MLLADLGQALTSKALKPWSMVSFQATRSREPGLSFSNHRLHRPGYLPSWLAYFFDLRPVHNASSRAARCYIYIRKSIYLYIYKDIYMYIYIPLCIYLHIYISISISVSFFISISKAVSMRCLLTAGPCSNAVDAVDENTRLHDLKYEVLGIRVVYIYKVMQGFHHPR